MPVDAVTLQNEPQNRHPSGYPGTDLPVAQEEKLAAAVGPASRRGPDTQILGYDHNWSEHPNDIAGTPPGEDPETDYPYRCCARAGRSTSTGPRSTATRATRAAMTKLHDTFPTRASGSPSAPARTAPATRRRRSSPTP